MTQMASDGLPATQGKAVFTHYGDQYFLRSVWVAGNTSHLICNSSKAERKSQIGCQQNEHSSRSGSAASRTLTLC